MRYPEDYEDFIYEAVNQLKANYMGTAYSDYSGIQKAYSVRVPIHTASAIEVMASKNNLSKNDILVRLLDLGFLEFFKNLSDDVKQDFLKELYLSNEKLFKEYSK